jgi:hypothetical protein
LLLFFHISPFFLFIIVCLNHSSFLKEELQHVNWPFCRISFRRGSNSKSIWINSRTTNRNSVQCKNMNINNNIKYWTPFQVLVEITEFRLFSFVVNIWSHCGDYVGSCHFCQFLSHRVRKTEGCMLLLFCLSLLLLGSQTITLGLVFQCIWWYLSFPKYFKCCLLGMQ